MDYLVRDGYLYDTFTDLGDAYDAAEGSPCVVCGLVLDVPKVTLITPPLVEGVLEHETRYLTAVHVDDCIKVLAKRIRKNYKERSHE